MSTWPEGGNGGAYQPQGWIQPGAAQDQVRFPPPPPPTAQLPDIVQSPPGWAQPPPALAQQPAWIQPGYQGAIAIAQPTNGMAIASLILGITSIVFCWWGLFSLAQVVLAIVFGAIALGRSNPSGVGRGPAIAGIICGCVGLMSYFIFGIFTLGLGLLI